MSLATRGRQEQTAIPTTEKIGTELQTVDKEEFDQRLDAAVRSTQKPILLPSFRDFCKDVSSALKSRMGTP